MRKVCVSAEAPSLEARVDPRFGRSPYLLIVDVESMQLVEAIQNPSIMAASGAGIQTAQMVAAKGVEAVITGNVGPNAYQVLSSSGVRVFTGAFGTVREAVEAYRAGRLSGEGLQAGFGGFGRGMGRGMGMGMGMGRGMWRSQQPIPPPPPSREDEISLLEAQMEALKSQLEEVKRRLRQLKGES